MTKLVRSKFRVFGYVDVGRILKMSAETYQADNTVDYTTSIVSEIFRICDLDASNAEKFLGFWKSVDDLTHLQSGNGVGIEMSSNGGKQPSCRFSQYCEHPDYVVDVPLDDQPYDMFYLAFEFEKGKWKFRTRQPDRPIVIALMDAISAVIPEF